MIVTTAGRTNEEMISKAKLIALELDIPFVERNKKSVRTIQEYHQDDCLVLGKERIELYPLGEKEPFFFHPNSAMFRIKRLIKGEHDPLVEATGLSKGKSFLDCTLGLASDSIVASFVVGRIGKVTGVEANPYLAYIVKNGLKEWDSNSDGMDMAMRRIEVHQGHSKEYLSALEKDSYDCVYLDPMFEESVLESDGIKALSRFAVYDEISDQMIEDALRVAKERVVLKDHFRSTRFERFGFDVLRRKTAKFHYGVLKKK